METILLHMTALPIPNASLDGAFSPRPVVICSKIVSMLIAPQGIIAAAIEAGADAARHLRQNHQRYCARRQGRILTVAHGYKQRLGLHRASFESMPLRA